ncbi:MAG: SDR family NAD(P)-dependent oxidoreductase [Nitrospinaceae bacterium]
MDPIAVIGLSCRFPGGVDSPEAYWDLLRQGRDAITEIPESRWNAMAYYSHNPRAPGKTVSRWGGFINSVAMFDPRFFEISPREAAHVDPQQRVLLECAWQALEDAGQVPERLAGSRTGVFIGISGVEFRDIMKNDLHMVDSHVGMGVALSVAANRLSYFFDFKGPSLAVDTACSSSLVAVHLACRSIWNGESELALAGGVNIILSPDTTIALGKGGMLSQDGRCKSFDAGGNGYVRGEGAGIVVLKPLAKALEDKDPIGALVLSTVVNQDGRTPGMPVPDLESQKTLLRKACRQAGIAPHQIQFVEAHGTGTPVGDPIEANAQGEVLVESRPPGEYCFIGSVKSNIGHLESASGIASFIKSVLALRHRQIPPNLHFNHPNPSIKFEEYRLRVPQTLIPWPETPGPAISGVNSFGFGGTNANVILQEAPPEADPLPSSASLTRPRWFCLPLSARCPKALKEFTEKYLEFFDEEKNWSLTALNDVCYTASVRRSHHDHRLALVGRSVEEMKANLQAVVNGERQTGWASGRKTRGASPKLVFVFSGQGPQWWGMGRQLLDEEPVFRETLQRCDELFGRHANWSLLKELTASESHSRINETHITQAAIFSLQVGLAELWRSWGVIPQAVIGHSMGEAAAAYVAGIYRLEDAVQIIYHRGRLLHPMYRKGKMVVVGLSAAEATEALKGYWEDVSIAAVNGPKSVTLSGDSVALEKVIGPLLHREIFCRYLNVEYAFHSHQMEPARKELLESLRNLRGRPAVLPFYSTVRGEIEMGERMDEEYWWENVRKPVLFYKAAEKLVLDEYNTFLELAPHPVLGPGISECFSRQSRSGVVLASLNRNEEDRRVLLGSLAALYCRGMTVDWKQVHSRGGRCVSLPSYPWQKERFWHDREEKGIDPMEKNVHPFLGRGIEGAHPVWQTRLDKREYTYLGDHVVKKANLFPGAGFVEMALAAGLKISNESGCVLESVEFHNAMFLPRNRGVKMQTAFDPSDGSLTIYNLADRTNQSWTLHASATLQRQGSPGTPETVDREEIRKRCGQETSAEGLYDAFQKIGLQYGPAFRGIERAWRGDKEALGLIKNPDALGIDVRPYRIHPSLLDAGFQLCALLGSQSETFDNKLFLPVGVGKITFHGSPVHPLWVHARAVKLSNNHFEADLNFFDGSGKVWIDCQGFRCRALDHSRTNDSDNPENWLYEWNWEPSVPAGSEKTFRGAEFFPSPGELTDALKPRASLWAKRFRRNLYYDSLEPQLERLCSACVAGALESLGFRFEPGTSFSIDALADRWGLNPKRSSGLALGFHVLENQGILSREGDRWEIQSTPPRENPGEIWQSLIRRFPDYMAELNLLRNAGDYLARFLNDGAGSFLEVLREDDPLWEHFYQDAFNYRVYRALIQELIGLAMDRLPEGRKLKVLELGAGKGGSAFYVMQRLNPEISEYVFSDSSERVLEKAARKFREFPFAKYQQLDIEADPLSQGWDAHSFDLILCSNLFPSVRNTSRALGNIRQLLSSEGLFVPLETTRSAGWTELISGALRLGSVEPGETCRRALSFKEWGTVLKDAGFTSISGLGETSHADCLQTLLFARGPRLEKESALDTHPLPRPDSRGSWLIFEDDSGQGKKLGESLKRIGENCVLVGKGKTFKKLRDNRVIIRPDCPEDMGCLIDSVRKESSPLRGIVHLWSLDMPETSELSLNDLETGEREGCLNIVYLVQELAQIHWPRASRLFLVTRGGQHVSPADTLSSVAQSPVWGLGQVIQGEHANLRCKMVDLDPMNPPDGVEGLVHELWREDAEVEIALRGNQRFVRRLVRPGPKENIVKREARDKASGMPPFVLEIPAPGILENFKLRETVRRQPGPGEVEIQVRAAALNFRDVMIAMGLLPEEMDGKEHLWETLGLECSGIITALGEGVDDFQVGDEVLALSNGGCFGAYALVPALSTVHKPENLSFEESATLPAAFLTAYYMLHRAGNLRKGERVLIHAASGGVGLAAVEIAMRAGAEVFATAGSEQKRDFLRALGVKHVFDSRSLAFADEILEITHGEGVDIVLNSLAGPFVTKSVSLLKPLGRFLEIGKRDIYQNNKVALRPFLKGISFITMVDFKQGFRDFGPEFRSIIMEIMERVRQGELHSLPFRVFPISNIVSAFRTMAQARHIGKIVVSMEEPALKIIPDTPPPAAFKDNVTYLITGGLGGFGLAAAKWMVKQGARHLALMGRKGASSDDAKAGVAILRGLGAEVQVIQGDVARQEDATRALRHIDTKMPPLKGILHGAMVLDDGLLIHLSRERLHRVMAPKVHGAWNLHQQSLKRSLDFFIMFSSVANIIGNPGQANYVAANTFLESLVHYRRAKGLPGQVIHWAPLLEVGIAARQKMNERLEGQGMMSLTPRQAVDMLGKLIQGNPVQAAVFPVNWRRLGPLFPSQHMPPRFSQVWEEEFHVESDDELGVEVGDPIRPKLLAEPLEDRPQVLGDYLQKCIARVLGLPPSKLEWDQPLTELGMDSLMAMELIVRIERDLEITLPVVRFLGGPSIEQMVPWMLEEMSLNESAEEDSEENVESSGNGKGTGKLEVASERQTEEV